MKGEHPSGKDEAAVLWDECGVQQVAPQVSDIKQFSPNWDDMPFAAVNQTDGQMKNSPIGIAAFIMGILAICTLGIFLIPEILGLVFGVMAISDEKKKRTLAIGGLVMSGIALALGIVILVWANMD